MVLPRYLLFSQYCYVLIIFISLNDFRSLFIPMKKPLLFYQNREKTLVFVFLSAHIYFNFNF